MMRISNMLQFTENHLFYCGRFFSLGTLQYTMLHSVYQPMIGTLAISLYHVLHDLLPAHQVGYSPIEQQRKLFLSLQLEQGVEGRRKLVEATSRLEAVGLLNSSRSYMPHEEDYIYIYHLLPPLLPHEFFNCHHLVLLLRDTIGQPAVMRLKETLYVPSPDIATGLDDQENLTVPFYELFRLSMDHHEQELDTAMDEVAVGMAAWHTRGELDSIGYAYEDIVQRFPRASRNRKFVERLDRRKDQLAFINYTSAKYRLGLQELCRLLDEDGIFDEAGELNEEVLSYRASLSYMQGNKRREDRDVIVQRMLEHQQSSGGEKPTGMKTVDPQYRLEVPELFARKYDQEQYNLMLRNEAYTGMLERYFKGKPSIHAIRLFERMHHSYHMPDEVINVIMHYIHTNELSWSRAFVESIFTDLMARDIRSFETAVDYIRERLEIAERSKARSAKTGPVGGRGSGAGASRTNRSRRTTPAIVMENVPSEPVTDEEFERILQKVRNIESRLK